MQRAFSFPVTVERSRTKERLEASLAGLCELELRKQRQECLVLGALALGEQPPPEGSSRGGDLACFSSWGQENLTLRRQLVRTFFLSFPFFFLYSYRVSFGFRATTPWTERHSESQPRIIPSVT